MLKDNVKKYRQLKGLTQKQLADKVGISGAFLSLIEQGKNKPSDDNLKKISEVLGVSVQELTVEKSNNDSPLMEVLRLLIELTKKELVKRKLWDNDIDYTQLAVFKTEINKTKYIFVYFIANTINSNSYEGYILGELVVSNSCLIIGNGKPIYCDYNKGEEKAFKSLYDIIMINQYDQTNVYKSINDLKNLLENENNNN